MEQGILLLADGTSWEGVSFGSQGEVSGDAVFFTGVVGYQEVLTDPAWSCRIAVMTYPHIGNCGITAAGMVSGRAWCRGMVAKEVSRMVSNWQAIGSIQEFAAREKIVLLAGVDTQGIVRHIRTHGCQPAVLATGDVSAESLRQKAVAIRPRLSSVSASSERVFPPSTVSDRRIVVVDCGIRSDHIRMFLSLNWHLVVVPWNTTAESILRHAPQGVVFSSGPEEPEETGEVVQVARDLLGKVPLLGIGLGSQILARALGGEVAAMACGHFGVNQAVKHLASGRCATTSQAHRFAVTGEFGFPGTEVTHINLTDATVEGFRHADLRVVGIQYSPGPEDAAFREFAEMVYA